MVFLLVSMTVMAILIAASLPLVSTEVQRDKEEELIFRGLQYAEGIRNFRRRYGRYANALKEMSDPSADPPEALEGPDDRLRGPGAGPGP